MILSDGTPRLIKVTHIKKEAGREIKQPNSNMPAHFETEMVWDGNVWDNFFYQGTDPVSGEVVRVSRSLVLRTEEIS